MAADTRRDIALDVAGDWEVATGDLRITVGSEAIIQSARIHLQFFQGEWFLDLLAGVPYWQQVLGKIRDPNTLAPIFQKALLEPSGVTQVQSLRLALDRSARTLALTFELTSDVGLLGPITLEVG